MKKYLEFGTSRTMKQFFNSISSVIITVVVIIGYGMVGCCC